MVRKVRVLPEMERVMHRDSKELKVGVVRREILRKDL